MRPLALAPLLAATLLATPAHAIPTTFTVTGQVGAPGTFDATRLGALPQVTQTDTYTSAGTPVTDTFTGPSLANVLASAGGIATNPAVKNDILRKYVIATGADGYKAVISAGEIAAQFGNRQDLVATSDTAGRLPTPDGFARIVAANDKAGGRYVSNLVNLDVRSAPAQPGTGGGVTTSFVVQGAVGTTMTFDLDALQKLMPHTQTVTYASGSASVTDTYTGAYLWDVLNAATLSLDPTIKNDVLRQVVSATGSDGYQVDFALGELSPMFGNAPILVAYSDTLGQLSGSAGFARIVVPGDTAGGRYVSNLASLTVFDATAVPEPATLALLAAALLASAALTSRRRRPRPGPA